MPLQDIRKSSPLFITLAAFVTLITHITLITLVSVNLLFYRFVYNGRITKDFSRLTRPHYPLPSFVKDALLSRGLLDAYHSRPAYQQNDYIGWITRAKQKETREKRLNQMLEELEAGDRYMGMAYIAKQQAT